MSADLWFDSAIAAKTAGYFEGNIRPAELGFDISGLVNLFDSCETPHSAGALGSPARVPERRNHARLRPRNRAK